MFDIEQAVKDASREVHNLVAELHARARKETTEDFVALRNKVDDQWDALQEEFDQRAKDDERFTEE